MLLELNKMKKYFNFLLIILVSGCASVYIAPNGQEVANRHTTIAIIKPNVSIMASKKVDAEAIKESRKTSANEFQQEIYKFLLKRKAQGKMVIGIQDVDETNAILSKKTDNISTLTTKEICNLLGVDAIMTSNFGLTKPMSTGAAIAMSVLVGFYGSTNEVTVSMSLKNCDDSSLLWKYDHKYSGGIGSSPARLVEGLMRDASKKMPYFSK